jgi:hypothetical protein
MERSYSVFSITKSIEFYIVDTHSKISPNCVVNRVGCQVPRVRFPICFPESGAPIVSLVHVLCGLAKQLFFSTISYGSISFGPKNAVEDFTIWEVRFTRVLQYFRSHCPDIIMGKFVSLGTKGNHFKYLRLAVLDIFNLFGPEFYQSFHISYFNFPGIFVSDFADNFWNSIVYSGSGRFTAHRSFYLRTLATFAKLLI